MKKALLILVLSGISAFAQPSAQTWYSINPSPAVGSSCIGLFPGIAGLITSSGPMTCMGTPAVWTLSTVFPIGSSQLQANTATGNTALRICHATFNFAVDGGGAPGLITPAANCTIPANSIIVNEIIDWTSAATGTGATVTIGTTGTGGGAAILQASGTVGSGLSGIVQGVIVPQTASGFKKITTAGTVTLTSGTAALTGGVCEIFIFWVQSPT